MHRYQHLTRLAKTGVVILLLVTTAFLAGCMMGVEQTLEAPAPLIPPDASGEQLYNMPVLGIQAGCTTCHSLDDTTVLGPSLQGIGSIAQNIIPNMSAKAYIRQSILEPDAYVLEGNSPGIMPPHYADALSETQLDALVTYLLSQQTDEP